MLIEVLSSREIEVLKALTDGSSNKEIGEKLFISIIMSLAPRNKLGIAGSVNSLVRNLGQIFGVTLATTVLYNFMSYKIGYHVINYIENRDDVFIFGMRYVYIMLAIICGIGAIITAFRLYSNKLNLIKA